MITYIWGKSLLALSAFSGALGESCKLSSEDGGGTAFKFNISSQAVTFSGLLLSEIPAHRWYYNGFFGLAMQSRKARTVRITGRHQA